MKLLTKEADLVGLSRDAGLIELRPMAAFVASSEAEVVEAMASSIARGLTLTPRGSGTSIPSQAVGTGAILLQQRTRASMKPGGDVECEPALIKADLNRMLESRGRWMPVDPSSYQSCSLGGMVSNNSSGSRTYKYGSTIDFVEELRVVLPDYGPIIARPVPLEEALGSGGITGRLASLLTESEKEIRSEVPKVTKNSSGYRLERVIHDGVFDLPCLFVGSEGTLGVVTLIRFSTRPRPSSRALLIFETGLQGLDGLSSRLRTHGPSAIELLDKNVFRQTGREDRIGSISRTDEDYLVFAEFDSQGEGAAAEALERVASDSGLAGLEPLTLVDPGGVASAWAIRNETLTVAAEMKKGARRPVPGVEDLVVPPERLGDLVRLLVGEFEGRGLDYISYGHAGDANLHMRPLLDPTSGPDMKLLEDLMAATFEAVWSMGGSMSGEHGDGMLRAPFLKRQYPLTHPVMKEVKSICDPRGVMNPRVKIV